MIRGKAGWRVSRPIRTLEAVDRATRGADRGTSLIIRPLEPPEGVNADDAATPNILFALRDVTCGYSDERPCASLEPSGGTAQFLRRANSDSHDSKDRRHDELRNW